MHMKKLLLASSALALLTGAPAAQAGDLYISVLGGANWLEDENFTASGGTTIATDPNTGFVLAGAIGTSLDNWLNGARVELEASYRRNDVAGTFFSSTAYVIDANASTFAVLANFWYDFNVGMKVKPYIGAGGGWGRSNFNGTFINSGSFDEDHSGFAWQVGAGFNYEVMPDVSVGVGYRYFNGPELVFDGPSGATDERVHNTNHQVSLNLTVGIN